MTEDTAVTRFLENPEGLMEYVERTGDFHAFFEYVNLIYDIAQTLDGKLDIILPKGEELYERLKPEDYRGMTFYEATVRLTRLAPSTIMRHTKVGRAREGLPEKFLPRFDSLDFKSKIYIASLIEDKVEVSDEQLGRIVEQPSYQGVAAEIQKVRGTEPRSQWCRFVVDENGTIWAYTAHGKFVYYEPKQYENQEVQEIMEWVHQKAIRKLGATPK